jgi:hypothetical protein
MTEEIRLVRKQLDSLASTRLIAPLDPASECVYQELCARERVLLDTVSQSYGSLPIAW